MRSAICFIIIHKSIYMLQFFKKTKAMENISSKTVY